MTKQMLKQREAEKKNAKDLAKKELKAEKGAEAARAQAIALMAGGDPTRATAVPTAQQTRKEEAKKLKKRKREREAEVAPPPPAAFEDESEGEGAAVGGAEADTDDDGTEPVASGQYEELRQQYELVKDELDEEEQKEMEAELAELYDMEGDPTGRGVEGAVMELPTKKGKKGKKKRKGGKGDGAAEAELSSMLAMADEVAEQQDDNVDKVVGKEGAKLACVIRPLPATAPHCRPPPHQVYPLLFTRQRVGLVCAGRAHIRLRVPAMLRTG